MRKDDDAANLFAGPSQIKLEGHNVDILEESFAPSERRLEMSDTDIWKLFNDAQRNIVYLNKQRLAAVEELKKLQREKELLLGRIEQLEAGKQMNVVEGTVTKPMLLSSFSELLLRIDSMVLLGMIGTSEASDIRKKVMDRKDNIPDVFHDIQQKTDMELLSELRQFSEKTMRKALHIVHICSEMEPVVSFGSLASCVTGLSCALQRDGNLVEVILPKYANMDLDAIQGLRKAEAEFDSYFSGRWHKNRVWIGVAGGLGLTLIEPVYHSSFFNRDRIYGYSDDFERFTYFSRASMDYLVKSGKQPDILHIHNWETAIIGPLFWDIFVHQGLGGTRVLFTCHDLSSQCLEQPDKLGLCGLDPHRLHRPDRLQDNNKTHLVNILKGGIVYSNKVVMMSSVLSKERIIHSLSHGLEPTLAIHKEKLLIAPYGFDGTKWDPSRDKLLPANYSADDIGGKAVCKVALRQRLGFSGCSSAIVGCIFSGVIDIDVDNLKPAIQHALRKGVQCIFMGLKTPVRSTTMQALQEELKDVNMRFVNKYDEALLHLILAGSDIILCSSFDDPLFQIPLKAIKYGSSPISLDIRNGGFRQFEGHDFRSISRKEGFRQSERHDFGSLMSTQYIISTFGKMSLYQALDEINNDPSRWTWRMKDGMSKDFSWDAECLDIHWAAYTFIKNL
ncbi:probable starch synthase 4, chloroplastic/amyloplastic isoform X3 [Phoenix dactylifera]|nr:probable starch synthase 4, chloroplastic/amyloplastic isoform X3 [Phoenix dactylifera]XP_026665529.2 probable starch synthase 4, chloroplastic/amyloplastic isoform X3 [Phoenix dactylifera]